MHINRYFVIFTAEGGAPVVVDRFATPSNNRVAYQLFKNDFIGGKYDRLDKGILTLAKAHKATMEIIK